MTRCPNPSGSSRWVSAPAPAACSTTTRSCRASTTSSRLTSTCRVARHGQRCCSTRSSPFTSRSRTPPWASTGSPRPTRPAAPGTNPEPVVISSRQGMFGVSDGGDTSGYGGLVAPVLFPAAAVRPYGGYFDEVAERLERALVGGSASYAQAIERVVIDRGEMTIFVAREHLVGVAQALRDDPSLRFEMCSGVSGVHYPHEAGRELHAVYHLRSITNGGRTIRLEVTCPDDDCHIPSIVAVYPAND